LKYELDYKTDTADIMDSRATQFKGKHKKEQSHVINISIIMNIYFKGSMYPLKMKQKVLIAVAVKKHYLP
jgi:Golgi nucleoside diphosphatase